ncbi:MAG: HEAT repeat domain-containing protein [Asgard group archaeon]|nr:HEAT repeat domain-containing protein [Asgard group archaeon]
MDHSLDDESPFKEDLEPLIKTLESDDDWNKRFGAASKLFRLGKEKAVDPLIKALQNDPHHEIRRFSADLLGRLGDPRATWALIAALRQALSEKDKIITFHTRDALVKIKSSDLPSILASTIDDKEEFFEMRIMALNILGEIADTKSVESLIQIINDTNTEGKIRGRAIEVLIYTGHLAGLQLVLDLLEATTNKNFQKVVARALCRTPLKNKTIVLRFGDALLRIMETEESKKEKKDAELTKLAADSLKQLASNINISFNQLMDEILAVRKKQK